MKTRNSRKDAKDTKLDHLTTEAQRTQRESMFFLARGRGGGRRRGRLPHELNVLNGLNHLNFLFLCVGV
jgi:hypothetical protein